MSTRTHHDDDHRGAGKSNILDSICFVLGITNLSSVRASNLQDLVYKQGQAVGFHLSTWGERGAQRPSPLLSFSLSLALRARSYTVTRG